MINIHPYLIDFYMRHVPFLVVGEPGWVGAIMKNSFRCWGMLCWFRNKETAAF